jgi:site-specific DNA-methyltransferase (adenine-specific)
MGVELHHGDCLDVMAGMEAESVDTVITDPPYGLEFMGKEWDHGVPGVAYWAEFLRVSKPGAMLCAFGGTRTHHRLMCAIEDAGWEIRDVLMWVYGSGFPKSHDVSKAIDKAAGAEREVVGHGRSGGGREIVNGPNAGRAKEPLEGDYDITSPATNAAALWDGWGTALKPAYEPIILAMKPLPGTFAQNALDYGVAGIWVDGVRVPSNGDVAGTSPSHSTPQEGWDRPWRYDADAQERIHQAKLEGNRKAQQMGRWPANLLLSHSPGCECVGVRKVPSSKPSTRTTPVGLKSGMSNFAGGGNGFVDVKGYASPDGTETIGDWRCVPECPVRMLDEGSGERGGGHFPVRQTDSHTGGNGIYGHFAQNLSPPRDMGDTGGASRFFTRFHYSAKASRSERELGLLGHIPCLKCGELDSLTHTNPKTGKEEKCRRNGHPTVKPLDVCRWLCRLTKTPTGGVVLDPFMGSGRIPMAAVLEGRDAIGIELERPSFEIAQAAVHWAEEQMPEMVQAEFVT